jgi:hypothetical protein
LFAHLRALKRASLAHIPFLAGYPDRSDAAVSVRLPNDTTTRYSAAALAVFAFVPLTTFLATSGGGAHATTGTPATVAAARHGAHARLGAATTKVEAVVVSDDRSTSAKAAAKPAAAKQAPAPAKPAAPTKPFQGVTISQLEPNGTSGYQTHFSPSPSQWSNATAIVAEAHQLGMSPYAATIAVATAMQESSLQDLTVATNYDSLGLFQQRPSMGWGSPSELTDPAYATKAFLSQLPSDYQHMDLATAAQSVQRSFDGALYAQWQDQAAHMVYSIANG